MRGRRYPVLPCVIIDVVGDDDGDNEDDGVGPFAVPLAIVVVGEIRNGALLLGRCVEKEDDRAAAAEDIGDVSPTNGLES